MENRGYSLLHFIKKVTFIVELKGFKVVDIDLWDNILTFKLNNGKNVIFAYRFVKSEQEIIDKVMEVIK